MSDWCGVAGGFFVCFGPGLAECAHAFLFCAYLGGSFFWTFKFFSWLHSGLKQASMKDRFQFLTTDWSGFDGVQGSSSK